VFLYEPADAFAALRQDHRETPAAGREIRCVLLQLAEPAAAIRSPGPAIEDEEQLATLRL
jgi:hypothetical protein